MTHLDDIRQYLFDPVTENEIDTAADLPTTYARSGQPSVAFGNVRLHSMIEPEAEANELQSETKAELESALAAHPEHGIDVVIAGPGLGYIIQAVDKFCRKMAGWDVSSILCLESQPIIARKALSLRIWEPVRCRCKWITTNAIETGTLSLASTRKRVIVRATPGYRLDRSAYEHALKSLRAPAIAERPMRILVPTPLYGGSYPMANYCASAFRKLGHQVEFLDLKQFNPPFRDIDSVTSNPAHRKTLQGLLTTFCAELIVARAANWKADLVWCMAQTPITPPALQELRALNIHTAMWFVEDAGVFAYWRELAPHFDTFFTIQKGTLIDELRQRGAKNAAYLPCAADPEVHRPLPLTDDHIRRYGSPVSFVGAGYRNRIAAFRKLNLDDLRIWGNDWPESSIGELRIEDGARRINAEESCSVFNASQVNINLHSSNRHDGIHPNGDFVNPRTFEIAACGAFQLVDHRRELSELFSPEEEIVVYESIEELRRKIEYFLAHPEERQRIAGNSRRRLLECHTYVHRMRDALSQIEQKCPRLAERKRGPNYVASLLEAASGDTELEQFLSRFDTDRELTLDDIVGTIKQGAGKISRAEGIFLLMKEFRDWGRDKGVIA